MGYSSDHFGRRPKTSPTDSVTVCRGSTPHLTNWNRNTFTICPQMCVHRCIFTDVQGEKWYNDAFISIVFYMRQHCLGSGVSPHLLWQVQPWPEQKEDLADETHNLPKQERTVQNRYISINQNKSHKAINHLL